MKSTNPIKYLGKVLVKVDVKNTCNRMDRGSFSFRLVVCAFAKTIDVIKNRSDFFILGFRKQI